MLQDLTISAQSNREPVQRSAQSYIAVIRRDYIDLLSNLASGAHKKTIQCAAAFMNYIHRWQIWKIKAQRTSWVYQPIKNIQEDLMDLFSKHVIRNAIALLMELGLMERRVTPNNYQDKTFQYKLNVNHLESLLKRFKSSTTKTTVESASNADESSKFKSDFREANAEQHTQIQYSDVIYKSIDSDAEEKEVSQEELVVLVEQVEIPSSEVEVISSEVKEILAPLSEAGEDQVSAAAPSQNFIEETRDKLKKFIGGFAPAAPKAPVAPKNSFKLEGADEETLELLGRHQAGLEQLNVDLGERRIQKAILDNPQALLNAIEAFYEASAKGKLSTNKAIGYFYNALIKGWKPKRSNVPAITQVQPFVAPPGYFDRKPPTLEELLEKNRQKWKISSLRSSVEAWVKETAGVILTDDGPVLEER